jgi:RHS repeat-associated protein
MGVWIFGYDQLNRLTSAANTSVGNWGTNFCWAYDSFGNRLAQSTSNAAFTTGENGACNTTGSLASSLNTWASYNRQNQVTGTTAAPGGYGYDGAGDVIYDGANGYLYDAEGRICAVTNGDGWTGYLYDAAGNRVAKGNITNPNGTCDITSNGFTPTAGYVVGPSGEQLTEVAWVSGGWNQWNHTNVYAGGKLIGTYDGNVAAPTLHFHIDDPLGTRRAQVSSTGVLEATYQSLPFGDGLNSIPYTTTAEDPTENHFTGKERDTESGNDYFLARYYNSATGRFLSPDWSAKEEPVPYAKLDNPQSLNLYSYMFNNPLGGVDKDGHGCGGPGEAPCPAATPAATPTSPQPFTVTLNSRAANIPGGGVLHDLGADHQWITTSDGQAAGMGSAKNGGQIPDKKGNSSPDKPLDPTMVVDEHGDKPTSTQTFTNVDKGAISSYLQVGQPTGPWIPGGNDCNTWAKNAISQSTPHDITYTPAGAPDLVPSTRVVQHNVVVYSDGSVHQPGGQQ